MARPLPLFLLPLLVLPPEAAATRERPLPRTAADAAGFSPPGWSVETQARGDLDGDGRPDLAFVLLAPDRPAVPPQSSPGFPPGGYANPRILGIAVARPEGGYRLALEDRHFLPRKWAPNGLSQGWMLFGDGSLWIERGRLHVIFEYTRSHRSFTFRRERGTFRLIGYDDGGASGGCVTSLSVNYLTNRAKMSAAWADRDEERVRWRRLQPHPVIALGAMGEGEEFDPQGLLTGPSLSCPDRE